MKFKKRRKNLKKYKYIAIALIFVIIAIYIFIYIDNKIMPTVQALGELRAQELTTRAINESVSVVIRQDIQYEDLVSVKEDEDGNITLMQANAPITKL